jgi:hypothetical protein
MKKTVKTRLEEIIFDLSWAEILTKYFEKSRSWLYHKLDGVDGNGKPLDFTEKEKNNYEMFCLIFRTELEKQLKN